MSLSVEHWVREWVAEIHPEWIEAVEAKQREIEEAKRKNEDLKNKYNQLARGLAFGVIKEERAAGALEEDTIRKIGDIGRNGAALPGPIYGR